MAIPARITQGNHIDAVIAGAGLTASGGTLAVGAGTGISVAADAVALDLTAALTWTGLQTHAIADAATNTVTDVLKLQHTTSGTAAAGFGAGILLQLEDDGNGAAEDAARISAIWTVATAGGETTQLQFATRSAGGALSNKWGISGAGTWIPSTDNAVNIGSTSFRVAQLHLAQFTEYAEIVDPAAPAADRARLYAKDNGSGKTLLVVRFATGAVQTIATEP